MKSSRKTASAQSGLMASPCQWVAILGAAATYTEEQVIASYTIGQALAERGKNVLTGATTGLPYAAAVGAHEAGAMVVGISPAGSLEEHVSRYNKPLDSMDLVIYSGMSVEGRGPLIVRSVAACIVIGGEFGTLNEFTAAWLIGDKIIGILTGNGGMADMIPSLLNRNKSTWGTQVICDDSPLALVNAVCDAVNSRPVIPNLSEHNPGSEVRETIRHHRRESSEDRQ